MSNQQELQHHGILGMKWGVRRYQNRDGSLTPAGKKRRAQSDNSSGGSGGKKAKKRSEVQKIRDENKARVRAAKEQAKLDREKERGDRKVENILNPTSRMSDQQIRDRLNRLNMENQLRVAEFKGKSRANRLLYAIGNDVALPAAKQAGREILQKGLTSLAAKKLNMSTNDLTDSLKEVRKEVEGLELKRRYIDAKNYLDRVQPGASEEALATARGQKNTQAKNKKSGKAFVESIFGGKKNNTESSTANKTEDSPKDNLDKSPDSFSPEKKAKGQKFVEDRFEDFVWEQNNDDDNRWDD